MGAHFSTCKTQSRAKHKICPPCVVVELAPLSTPPPQLSPILLPRLGLRLLPESMAIPFQYLLSNEVGLAQWFQIKFVEISFSYVHSLVSLAFGSLTIENLLFSLKIKIFLIFWIFHFFLFKIRRIISAKIKLKKCQAFFHVLACFPQWTTLIEIIPF